MKKKVCKTCKIVVTENVCPLCRKTAFTTNFQGQINIIDANKSMLAKKIGIKSKGDYAIKIN